MYEVMLGNVRRCISCYAVVVVCSRYTVTLSMVVLDTSSWIKDRGDL